MMTIQADRLHDQLDAEAIADVAIKYCWALDENDWAQLDDVFLPDATAACGNKRCSVVVAAGTGKTPPTVVISGVIEV